MIDWYVIDWYVVYIVVDDPPNRNYVSFIFSWIVWIILFMFSCLMWTACEIPHFHDTTKNNPVRPELKTGLTGCVEDYNQLIISRRHIRRVDRAECPTSAFTALKVVIQESRRTSLFNRRLCYTIVQWKAQMSHVTSKINTSHISVILCNHDGLWCFVRIVV